MMYEVVCGYGCGCVEMCGIKINRKQAGNNLVQNPGPESDFNMVQLRSIDSDVGIRLIERKVNVCV